MSLKLYDAARVIANPFAYAEAREKAIADKMAKLADSRIRARKDALPKVNRALAEKILKDGEREARKQAKKLTKSVTQSDNVGADGMEVDVHQTNGKDPTNVLIDPRFKEMFENPEFQVDETSREYALLHPAAVGGAADRSGSSVSVSSWTIILPRHILKSCHQHMQRKRKTAVEEEEEESDPKSSDEFGESSDSDSETSEGEEDPEADSSDEGGERIPPIKIHVFCASRRTLPRTRWIQPARPRCAFILSSTTASPGISAEVSSC